MAAGRRIRASALASEAPANFGATWEEMARMSWKTLRSYLGLPGNPVTFTDHYRLSDAPFGQPTPRDPDHPAAAAAKLDRTSRKKLRLRRNMPTVSRI